MTIDLNGQTAIVTGAAQGLGRSYAKALAAAGAKVIVNDVAETDAGHAVVSEINDAGGKALFAAADVTDPDAVETMVERAVNRFGRVDILINNAGILRDKTFGKMAFDDFRKVVEVHLLGSAIVTQAVWGVMRAEGYGRIVMATSSSGLYGNFGQSNYAAAKMGLIGLMNTLNIEGQTHDIAVNAVAPVAYTQMTAELFPAGADAKLSADLVAPAVVFLASRKAPRGAIVSAGGGAFAFARLVETEGYQLGSAATPDDVARAWHEDGGTAPASPLPSGRDHSEKFFSLSGLTNAS